MKENGDFSIWHETFQSPAGHWETIYVNSQPTLLAGGSLKIKSESGEDKYVSTMVDAKRGVLRSSKGRMARTAGDDNDAVFDQDDLY
jgi:hypothetical protein